jgi:mannose-6-phosphate isomerase-like protein (cupin superfamily)
MNYDKINFKEKFSLFVNQWTPKIIAQMNDIQFKLAKIQGAFVWHKHPDTDEAFIVIEEQMKLEFRDRCASLQAGEMIVVPKGVEHKPVAENEAWILMVEPMGTINTGDSESDMTIEEVDWI